MTKNKILICLLGFVLIASTSGLARQRFGNEWIVNGQQYFKMKVALDGIYRVSSSDLQNAGFPTNIDPRRIQIFHLGTEQAINVQTNSGNALDYVEFYGQRKDGTSDTELYVNASAQPHTFYNLFSDTSAYFITYRLDNTDGVRMELRSENNVSGIPDEEYYIEEQLDLFTTNYAEGQSYGSTNETVLSQYDFYEGWTGDFATLGQSLDFTISGINNTFQQANKPVLSLLLAGGNNNSHNVEILVGTGSTSLRSLTTVNFNKDETRLIQEEIEWSDISSSGTLFVRATVNGVGGAADRVAVSYVRLQYPRTFDIQNVDRMKLTLRQSSSDKSFVRIFNPVSGSQVLDITDPNLPVRIGTNGAAQELNAVVSGTSSTRTLLVQSQALQPTIEPVTFETINPSLYDYIIITNDSLRQSTSNGDPDPVGQYAAYRASAAGGNYRVYVADIEEIFEQFNYGEISPMAIRRFADYMLDGGDPTHLFIIGRSTSNASDFYRQAPGSVAITNFVPNYGHPGSDTPFTAGLEGTSFEPAIATGRINAKSPDDVQAYLNKVIEAEAQPYNDLWHKNLIHLSGGRSQLELNQFKSYINGFKAIAAGPLLGASVAQNSKNTNSEVEFFNISEEVNKGVSIITFFGHSSASVTDIEIGLVSNPAFGYANKGRYPIFVVNGCNAGDFFSATESFGVDWLLTPDRGAIGFMAHSSIAFSNNLRSYTNLFYTVAFAEDNYFGLTLGEIKKEVSRRYIQQFGTGQNQITQVQQFVLQGDPAIKVFSATQPDYDITENNITVGSFDGSMILASTDSFYVDIDIKNYGKFDSEPLNITLRRTLSNGSITDYGPVSYNPVLRQDTLRFIIDNRIQNPEGNNTFLIVLDETNLVTELDETNNTASFDLFLANGSTFNVLPNDFGVVQNPMVNFAFQATDVLSGNREFLLEIDTTIQFNSPYLMRHSVTSNAAGTQMVNLEANGSLTGNTVVYWRTKFANPLPDELDEWVQSSFTLDKAGTHGWKQVSTHQLNQLNSSGLNIDTSSGVWEFPSNNTALNVTTYGPNHPSLGTADTELTLDGQNIFITASTIDPGCRTNTINILAFDRQSTIPYAIIDLGTPDVLDDRICGTIPQIIYNFTETELSNSFNPQVLIDNINSNDQVLVFSLGAVNYSTWSTDLKDRLVDLGIRRNTLDNLQDGEPIIFFGRKGNAEGTAVEVLSSINPKNQQEVRLSTNIAGSFFSGNLVTNKIGPSMGYGSFTANLDVSANNASEIFSFDIIGVDKNDQETTLIANRRDFSLDLSSVDHNNYPFLKLRFDSFDDIDLTPPQLRDWGVTFQPAPEGILLRRSTEGIQNPINKQEGEAAPEQFTFWNVSGTAFPDSIKVNFDLLNTATATLFKDSIKLRPLASQDSINFELALNTRGKNGTNDLILGVNSEEQTEVHVNNNQLRLSSFLEITPDATNPILEVSFDGVFILDGDVVSPNPNILVNIRDENQFLFKEDTSGINLFLRRPCEGCGFERVAFSSPEVSWTAATASSDFQVEYRPQSLENGMYGLQVQASDASGNTSGILPYEINFEVINESTITNFYPYPNPFSSSTRFVFTLTGNEIPTDIKIQIMTVTGRVVREILREELGPIHVGNNITDYAWDGRDEYGDQLANGVYLYRVIIKNNGNEIQQRATSADRAFKNGFGKLYLLR